ncbi:MAG: enoyl-CoA hydratase-related protein [candidate division WOR-3 bacterium]|nr:enoyl-CoA hydratase-related protein [candidate division WOR-3 bacterium]
MEFKYLNVAKEDHIAIVKLNRPPVNALNTEMILEMEQAFEELAKDEELRSIVLTGEGKAFVAGADISEMKDFDPIHAREFAQNGHRTLNKIEGINKPVIAAINGFALGGGCEIALACDIRIMAEGAKVGQPEVNLGVIPGFGGTQRLSRLCGAGIAKELIYTGEAIDAQDALRIGLVNKVVPPDKVFETALEIAKKITAKGPRAIRFAKMTINQGMDTDLHSGNSLEIRQFSACFGSEEAKEGMNAFLEKRKPNW